MHRWRLSSSPSPLSPLSSLDCLTLSRCLGSLPDAAGIVCGSLRLDGSGLSALGLAMICGPGRSPLSVLSLLLALPAALLLFSSAASVALPAELYGLRRSAAALLGLCSSCLRVPGLALCGSSYCTILPAVFRLFFLPFVRLATHKIIDFCPDFW